MMAVERLSSGELIAHRYRIKSLLGCGVLGRSYLCTDALSARSDVAVKVLHKAHSSTAALKDRFSSFSRLRHPNLIRVLDFGSHAQTSYVVTEFVPGDGILEATRGWQAEELVRVLVEVCHALRHLQSRGIVHQNLKASNVLLTRDNSVKVTDFGLSQARSAANNGAATYTAPELLMSHAPDVKSDLYSLGILAYQLLAKRLPFEEEAEGGYLAEKHLQGKPDLRPIERLSCGAKLRELITQLLEKDPAQRPSSPDEVIRLLSLATGEDYADSPSAAAERYFCATRFVAREKEMSLLEDRLQRVRDTGRGWTTFITGESGVGKTRCLEELRYVAALQGWRVLEASCLASEEHPYGPYRRLLDVTERMSGGAPGHEEIFRADESSQIAEPLLFEMSSDPAAGRFRDRLTRELVRRLAEPPTLLLLHDFHFADEATTAVLDYLTSDVLSQRVFICVSLRAGLPADSPLARLIEQSARQMRAEALPLEVLSQEATEQLIAGITGEPALASSMAGWVYRGTGGNPFFVEEILKHLVDRGVLRQEQGAWRMDNAAGLAQLPAPAGIATLLRERLSQVSEGAQGLAKWLAVVNRPFPKELLGELLAGDMQAATGWIEELEGRQIVRVASAERDCLEFRHALVSDVICASLDKRQLQRMHCRIGEVLARHEENEGSTQEIAWHLTEGKAGARSAAYALAAAARCKAEFANETALHYYDYLLRNKKWLTPAQQSDVAISAADSCCALGIPKRAVRILKSRLASPPCTHEERVSMLMHLAYTFQCLGDLPRLRETNELGLASLAEFPIARQNHYRAVFLIQLAYCSMAESRPDEGLSLLLPLRELLHDSGAVEGRLYSFISVLYRVACKLQMAVKYASKAVRILEPLRALHQLPIAYSNFGAYLNALGRFAHALNKHERAIELSQRTLSVFHQAQALSNFTEALCRSGRLRESAEASAKLLKLAEDTGNRDWLHMCSGSVIETYLTIGNYRVAYQYLSPIISSSSKSLPIYVKAQSYFCLAWFHLELGDWRSALRSIREVKRISSAADSPAYETGLSSVLLARILICKGKHLKAARLLFKVSKLAKQNGWRYHRCVAQLWLSEALLRLKLYRQARRAALVAKTLAHRMASCHLEGFACLQLAKLVIAVDGVDHVQSRSVPDKWVAEALAYLECSKSLAYESGCEELIWQTHLELARLCRLTGDVEHGAQHASKTVEYLNRIAKNVPQFALRTYRRMRQRRNALAEAKSIINYRALQGEAVQHSDQHFRSLCKLSAIINQTEDLSDLMEALLDLLLDCLDVERAYLLLIDSTDNKLQLAKARNSLGDTIVNQDDFCNAIVTKVFRSGSPLVTANVASDPRFQSQPYLAAREVNRLFAGPLRVGGRLTGVLYVDGLQPTNTGWFDESQITLFSAASNIVALAVDRALSQRRLAQDDAAAKSLVRVLSSEESQILGNSKVIDELRSKIAIVARSPLDVLICGESGTGKELVARAIHRNGRRFSKVFVPVDCGTLSDNLVESELFGYRKGAFTGAVENRAGLLESADGGVVFLDEISNLSIRLQGKLLRVLQEREVRRLGDTAARKIDVQVIAATNRDLKEEIRRSRFRRDLYYRLNGMEIIIPPLRKRLEDIPILAQSFVAQAVALEGGVPRTFSVEAAALLSQYDYPGNVRELKNIVQSAYYSSQSRVMDREHLPSSVQRLHESKAVEDSSIRGGEELYREIRKGAGGFQDLVRQPFVDRHFGVAVVRHVIHRALVDSKGRYREAFRLLRIPQDNYSAAMVFLKRHQCYLDFRPYRESSKKT
jgi:Nif-specific regulatory protein